MLGEAQLLIVKQNLDKYLQNFHLFTRLLLQLKKGKENNSDKH